MFDSRFRVWCANAAITATNVAGVAGSGTTNRKRLVTFGGIMVWNPEIVVKE